MIAHAFPPEGAAGVYRPLRFIRHLPAMGWHGHVVASNQYYYERYDPALLELVPKDTEIVRVRGSDPWQAIQAWRIRRGERNRRIDVSADAKPVVSGPQGVRSRFRLGELVQKVEAWSYHPDRAMLWIRPAVKATVEMCTRKKADVIWATAGPVSSFIVAQQASQRTGVPYVLDFRDSWTVTHSDFEARRPKWAIYRDRENMYALLRGARAITFRYQSEAECYWRVYPGALDTSRIHIIPNGYEGAIENSNSPRENKCKILYAGTVSSYRYDTLLQALHRLKRSAPDLLKRLQFQFIGEGAQALLEEASALGLADLIRASGPIPHEAVSRLSREAHALLVLGRPASMMGHELMAGAKLFDYLKQAKPIIGILPAGESKNVLDNVGAPTVADVESPCEIVAVFQRLVDAWSRGSILELAPDRDACEAYSAERQTAALARALERRPAMNPFVPEAVAVPSSLRAEVSARSRWAAGKKLAWEM